MKHQVLITIDAPKGWDAEDFDWAIERVDSALSNILVRGDYTIEELKK